MLAMRWIRINMGNREWIVEAVDLDGRVTKSVAGDFVFRDQGFTDEFDG